MAEPLRRATIDTGARDFFSSGHGPQTFMIEHMPEDAPYMDGEDYAPGVGRYRMAPMMRHGGDFCTPPMPGIGDIHPGVRLSTTDYMDPDQGGVIIELDGVYCIQPRYNLIDVQSYLMGNPWHYAAVKAKATAATRLGYKWRYNSKPKTGIVQPVTKILTKFEENIYAMNHKDIGALLYEQAIDYFSTGNRTLEVAYNLGGKVGCLYSVPAVTMFRHPNLPIAVQILMPWENYFGVLDGSQDNHNHFGMQVKAVMPLFMSGWTRDDILGAIPDINPDIVSDNQLVHSANIILSSDPIYGLADVLPAISSVQGDNAANDYNWQFFENNAIPRYAVTVTGGKVDEKVKNLILKFFNEQIQGRNHRTIVLPVPRGMTAEFKALDATPNEASFIQYKKLNREEIAAVHSVPPSEIGLWEDANKANSNQQSKNFFLKVIKPYQSEVEVMMNRLLQYGMGVTEATFVFKNVEYTDDQERAGVMLTRAQAHKAYVDSLTTAIKAVSGAAGGSGSGGGASGGGGWGGWGNRSIEDDYDMDDFISTVLGKLQAEDKPKGDKPKADKPKAEDPAAQPKPDPVIKKVVAEKFILFAMDQITKATETFGLVESIDDAAER